MSEGCGLDVGGKPIDITIQKRARKYELIVDNGNSVAIYGTYDRFLDAITVCAIKFRMVRW